MAPDSMLCRDEARMQERVLAVAKFSMCVLLMQGAACSVLRPPQPNQLDFVEIQRSPHDEVDDLTSEEILEGTQLQTIERIAGMKFSWVTDRTFAPDRLQKDLALIERNYRHKGYRDVRVSAARVVRGPNREVRVQLHIEPGERTKVTKTSMIGLDGQPRNLQKAIRDAIMLLPGEPYDEKRFRQTWASVRRALDDEGYAHARVSVRAVFSALNRTAEIVLRVNTGKRCTVGAIQFDGLSVLREPDVLRLMGIRRGDAFSTRTLRRAENTLSDLGIFSSVQVTTVLPRTSESEISVRVRVRENAAMTARARALFRSDALHTTLVPLASFRHHNVWGGLRTLEIEAATPLVFRPNEEVTKPMRVGAHATLRYTQPSFLEAKTQAFVRFDGGIVPDPLNDFRNQYFAMQVGVERRWGPFVQTYFRYIKRFDWPTAYEGSTLPVNVRPFQQGLFEFGARFDTRDDAQRPHHGMFASTVLEASMGAPVFFAGSVSDVRFVPEVRLYAPLTKDITISARVRFGLLFPMNYDPVAPREAASDPSSFVIDDSARSLPWARAFYSGGQASNRGYGLHGVGLRDCATRRGVSESGTGCSVIVGGASLWETSLEARWDWTPAVSARMFLDAGDVSRNVLDLRMTYPHVSTGLGFDVMAPFGMMRFDFGVRIPGLQRIGGSLDAREEARALTFGLQGPFALHFSFGDSL